MAAMEVVSAVDAQNVVGRVVTVAIGPSAMIAQIAVREAREVSVVAVTETVIAEIGIETVVPRIAPSPRPNELIWTR